MGRNIRFWIAPGIKNDNVLTPTTLTVHTDAGVIAVIDVRPPVLGEQGWQCWPDLPLVEQVREMLTDWGGDPPGWTATRNEENGNAADCYYITVLAAFDLPSESLAPRHSINPIRMHSQAELMKLQGFKPGAEAHAANLSDEFVRRMKATPQPSAAPLFRYDSTGKDPRRNPASGMVPAGDAPDLDAARRACKSGDRKSFVTIELEIEAASAAEARSVVSHVLDSGALQDEIGAHDAKVISAVLK